MAPAQWREVLKDKVYALYVYEHHRIAIAQLLDQGWVVTIPDDPATKHPAKNQEEAFRIGRKVSVAWLQGALKQLAVEAPPRTLTPTEVQAELKGRRRGFNNN
jgi:hypothetical protein